MSRSLAEARRIISSYTNDPLALGMESERGRFVDRFGTTLEDHRVWMREAEVHELTEWAQEYAWENRP